MKGIEFIKPIIIIMVMAGLTGCHKKEESCCERQVNAPWPSIKVGKFFIDSEDNSSCSFYIDIKAVTPVLKQANTKIRACGPKSCSEWQVFPDLPFLDKGQTFTRGWQIKHCPKKVTRFEVKVLKEYLPIPWDNKYVHAKVLSWSKQESEDDGCMVRIKASIDHLIDRCIEVVGRDKEGKPRSARPICQISAKGGKPLILATRLLLPCKAINSITLQQP